MASRYNIAATLRVNNKGFIAGFAAAERAVDSFNRTVLTANGAAMAAQGTMAAAASSMAASAGTMASGTDRSRDSMRRMGDSAVDTRGRLVTAMNGMTTATNVFTSSMADSARGMQATAGSSDRAARGFQLVDRNASGANRSLFTTAANAAAAGGAAAAMSGDVQSVGRQTGRMASAVELANRDLDRFNRTARGFAMTGMVGAVATVVTAFQSLKIFGEYEQSLADLNKVIDASDAEMREFDLTFRELNNTIPVTYNELAETAAVAGQLGIEQEHIADFAETMVRMGSSTVLSSEDAAMAIARLTNIMGSSQGDADRFGAAIVDLGNNFAAQEDEIVTMAMRIAGMGAQLNMSEGDVLAMATSLTSLGIRAEMGGSAISRTMSNMNMDVQQGTETGQRFAEVMGLSIEETATLLEEDAYGALIKFVEGLEAVEASGGNVDETLQELGITELRQMDTLRRLVGASEELTRAQEIGNGAWEENIALIEESETRYDTFFGRLQIIANSISDVMSNVGNAFAQSGDGIMATIQDVLLNLEEMTNGFFDANGGITETGEAFVETATKIGGILTVIGLAGAAFMMFGPYGAVTVAAVAGLAAIGYAVDDLITYLTADGLEGSMRHLEDVSDDTTREAATSWVEAKDEINQAVADMAFADSAEEAAEAADRIVEEVEGMVEQIHAALDEEQAAMTGLIEGYFEGSSAEVKDGLKKVQAELDAAYEQRKQEASNQAEAVKNITQNEIDEQGRITQEGLMSIQNVATGMDGVFGTAVATNVQDMHEMSLAFDDVSDNSQKVQGALTEYSAAAADSIAELNNARDEEINMIKTSIADQEAQNFLIDNAEAKYGELEQAILGDVLAREEEARAVDATADATEGLTTEQKELLGAYNDSMQSAADHKRQMRDQEYGAKDLSTAYGDLVEKNNSLRNSLEEQAKAINETTEDYGSLKQTIEAMGTVAEEEAYKIGEGFVSKMADGTEVVDMGTHGQLKVDEFVQGVREGDIKAKEAAIGMINAVRTGVGMETLTPEGEAAIQSFTDGLSSGEMHLQTFAQQLGLDLKEDMYVDTGTEGVQTIESFQAGLQSGEYGAVEVAHVLMSKIELALDGDLSDIGRKDIETLVAGLDSGIISVDDVMATIGSRVEEGAEIELGEHGAQTIQSMVLGLANGELEVDEFMMGLALLIEEGAEVDVFDKGSNTSQSFADGLTSGKDVIDEAARNNASSAEIELGKASGHSEGASLGDDFSRGILEKSPKAASAAWNNVIGAENEFMKASDGGGGEKSGRDFFEGISNWLFPSAGAAEMTSSEVERAMGDTDDGGGGSNAGSTMALGITGQIANARSSASSAKSNVENVLGSTTDNGGGSSAGGIFASGILSMVGRSRSSADSNKSNVEDSLGSTTDADGGTSALQKYVSDISSYTTQAYNVANNNRRNVEEALGATTDGNGGHTAGSMFVSGVAGQAGPASSAGSNVSSNARSGLSSNSNTYGLGQNFGSGFVSGIRSYVGAAVRAAANLARSAINAVKRQQRSSSPSKVMAGLGRDNVDGYVLGISKQTKEAVKASANLAQSSINSFNHALGREEFSIDTSDMFESMNHMRHGMRQQMTAAIHADNKVELSHRQPAHIYVDIGGQEFETFSDNIFNSSTRRADFRSNYDV